MHMNIRECMSIYMYAYVYCICIYMYACVYGICMYVCMYNVCKCIRISLLYEEDNYKHHKHAKRHTTLVNLSL